MEPLPSDDKLPEKGRTFGVPRLREQVLHRLAEAYSDNSLDLEEYESRVRLAQQARTIEQLQKVLEDFDEPRPPHVPAPTAGHPEVFFALIGDREITAQETGGGDVRAFTVIGDVRIDLSQLRAGDQARVISISLIGDTKLLVPPGATVVRRFVTLIGDFKRKKGTPAHPAAAPCTVIIEGFKLIGDVVVTER